MGLEGGEEAEEGEQEGGDGGVGGCEEGVVVWGGVRRDLGVRGAGGDGPEKRSIVDGCANAQAGLGLLLGGLAGCDVRRRCRRMTSSRGTLRSPSALRSSFLQASVSLSQPPLGVRLDVLSVQETVGAYIGFRRSKRIGALWARKPH